MQLVDGLRLRVRGQSGTKQRPKNPNRSGGTGIHSACGDWCRVANRHGEDRGGSNKLDAAHHLLPGQKARPELTAVARIILLNITFSFGRTGLPLAMRQSWTRHLPRS
jgi:hypothetical protein